MRQSRRSGRKMAMRRRLARVRVRPRLRLRLRLKLGLGWEHLTLALTLTLAGRWSARSRAIAHEIVSASLDTLHLLAAPTKRQRQDASATEARNTRRGTKRNPEQCARCTGTLAGRSAGGKTDLARTVAPTSAARARSGNTAHGASREAWTPGRREERSSNGRARPHARSEKLNTAPTQPARTAPVWLMTQPACALGGRARERFLHVTAWRVVERRPVPLTSAALGVTCARDWTRQRERPAQCVLHHNTRLARCVCAGCWVQSPDPRRDRCRQRCILARG
ncbi:hypothetical protein EXIGLDRAFT_207183 [Exidia glandulosa HHB12029]|uniref:Uncharacterized protein n=1 Tax=Exidia glandulosa HHB12029 TaxID=1314781 RepID=A0A165EMC9_EXIGL|nr:hypothetical protein EXIGLDRAFT_207183 [Exidia glandulosa HHB12029]